MKVLLRFSPSHLPWSLFLLSLAPAWAGVVINEIHYAPDIKTEHVEFIELYNPATNAVDLAGWLLTDAVDFTFPAGSAIGAGGYVVVAQDPAAFQAKFGLAALGPWTGLLANEGDQVTLRDATGQVVNAVDYQLGFPWPTVGDPPGYSIELVNPALDNSLGGSWRASVTGDPAQQSQSLIAEHADWRYFKGLTEASSPTTSWRDPGFDDSSWESGGTPVGYGEPNITIATTLDDMRYNYTSVFLRKTFVVPEPAQVSGLTLEALYDDGFKVWINGSSNLLSVNISSAEVPCNGTASSARESYAYEQYALNSPSRCLVPGTNVIAVQVHNSSLSDSSDLFFDLRLTAQIGPALGRGPTPGRENSVFAPNLPPQIRQVEHHPTQPAPGQPVTITSKVTDPDGVASVTLQYQLVDPGNYIERADAAYSNNWTTLPLNDAGTGGDVYAADGTYTAQLPASLQTHRRLVRYRITASDLGGRTVTVPYPDDPQPNFAYFVYGGVPAWTGAVRPGDAGTLGQVFTVSSNEMNRLPTIHLLARKASVEDATWLDRYWGDAYPWIGTLVYDGQVYDHIHYRARGGVWRYSMCKNMWKFDFNRGHDFAMHDDWGRPYRTRWTKLNLGASIQQGDYNHRGEQGMFESVGFRLFNLAGVETCHTTFVQFRIIDQAAEVDPQSQYEGDFWGVYLVTEQEDGRFLDEHDLPDGNFYKMEGGTGELNNLGPDGPTDKSDLVHFQSGLNSTSSDAWWRANWYLPNGYSYQAIVQAIHHFDIAAGKNYFYHTNAQTRLWTVHPWDLDLTWAENMYDAGGYGGEAFKSYALPRPAFNLEYRNRVRELRDLLYNADQTWQLIDEYAGRLRGPTNQPSLLDADRAQWDYNPKMVNATYTDNPSSKAGQGRFYKWPNEPTVSKDFNGCVQLMKNYVLFRSTNSAAQGGPLDRLAADTLIPATPVASYTGPTNFPINRLSFRSSPFSGSGGFAAMKWRIGEITRPTAPSWTSDAPWAYEIESVWESGDLTTFVEEITAPAEALKVGHLYRARVLMKDLTGRTSHWSPPVEFVVGEPDRAAALIAHLRISELMYHPPGGDDDQFIELVNTSSNLTLALGGAAFTDGIEFHFPADTTMAPGSYLLVVQATNANNFAAFRARHGLDTSVPIAGPFTGSLKNGGEQVTLRTAAGGTDLASFEYGDGRGWPVAADGAGHSLVPLDRALNGQATGALDYPGNWRASTYLGGSPGRADPPPPAPSLQLNEIAAHTDYLTALDSNDWIELFNALAADLRLEAGWCLSDDPAALKKWMIPTNTVVPARGWISFDEVTGFHNPTNTGFGLDKAGEQVLLSYLPGTAGDRVVDAVTFKGQENERSLGRHLDGGTWWYALGRTRDTANSGPLPGVVINELMYHPPPVVGTNDNTQDEYVQLFNPTATPINLYDTNGTWSIGGGLDYRFPPQVTLPAGGELLVVNFDPLDAGLTQAFRTKYGLTDASVPLFGPYSGKLGNRSDRVTLEKRQYPDLPGDPYSWVIVDEVIYGNQAPWPTSPNGQGDALHRRAPLVSGDDPANWTAGPPSPGQAPVSDHDGDGMPDDWEITHGFLPDDPTDATADADADVFTNLQEYLAGTDPRDPNSRLQFERVAWDGTNVSLQFFAMPGKTYSVQYCNGAVGGGWPKLGDVDAQSSRVLAELLDPVSPAPGERIYRLVTPSTP